MNDFNLPEPDLGLPSANDPLSVDRPIGPYEPSKQTKAKQFAQHKPESTIVRKKKFQSEPKTQAEMKDCSEELSGEKLQKITAGPKSINFGSVFVNSVSK